MSDYILIVEDEILIAMDIEMTLMQRGLGPVVLRDTPMGALKRIAENPPRAALLDINLGRGQTSLSIARRLADLGAPFVFLSGDTGDGGLPADLQDVPRVSKPFNEAQLNAAVSRMIGESPAT